MGKKIKVRDKVLTPYGVGTFVGVEINYMTVRLHGKKNKRLNGMRELIIGESLGWSNGSLKEIKTKTRQGLVYTSFARKIK